MKKTVWWLLVLIGVGLIGGVIYQAVKKPEIEVTTRSAPPEAAISEPAETASGARYPIPTSSQKPLPPLNQSDPAIQNELRGLWSGNTLERLLQLDDFIRRVVATVDNLPRKKVPRRLLPAREAPGRLLITGKDKSVVISEDNAARYGAYVRMAETVDVGRLVAFYFHFYPLFQQAYQDLGYPKGHFNDRLIVAIDDALATPEVKGPIALVKPEAFYLFADPGLEALSAGQKVMLRMGHDNAGRIKAKLREIRGELTKQAPETGPGSIYR